MQVFFSPSRLPPRPPRSANHSNSCLSRSRSFKAEHTPGTARLASTPSLSLNTPTNRAHSLVPVVDLTDSPTSSCSSDAAHSPAPSPSRTSPSPCRVKRPYPPPSFTPIIPSVPTSKSAAVFSTPIPNSAPANLVTPSRADTPRRRATFILSGDCDSDDRDREGEGSSVIDDSDSDRTSFFSAEDYVISSTGHDASSAEEHSEGWRVPEQHREQMFPEETDAQQDGERDAAHALRRWHALMEVVHTEAGYVRDLRTLVHVYLALLPSLPLSAPAQEAVQALARDGAELLALHERFARALEHASAPAAGGASPTENVDDAVRQVAGLFVNEASTFDLYQRFCAAQPDTLRLLRSAQARAEWMIFERRCAAGGDADVKSQGPSSETRSREGSESSIPSMVASAKVSASSSVPTAVNGPRPKSPPPRAMSLMPSAFKASSQVSDSRANHRRHSYDSLAGVFGVSGSGSLRHRPGMGRPASDPVTSSAATPTPSRSTKLRFHDFLIKPIQRICKYPLMLEGLRSKRRGQNADIAVASAVDTMRAVVLRVDEARRRREAAAKSKLVLERIEPHPVVTPDFLTSLGDCLLAGSLDIVHHHHIQEPITTPVRVKYLGVFLYSGGYLLIVKVGKSKVYRLKHWFSLAPFELVDIPGSAALVPSSFRLSYMDYHFEMAASCQREKDLWLRGINEARRAPPAWRAEPASSLQILHTELSILTSDGSNLEPMEPSAVMKRGASSSSMSELSNPLALLRLSSTRFRPSAPTPTVRYIFSRTDGQSLLLRRSTGANRVFVERGLADVMTDLVSSLRKHAQARQETLFSSPHLLDSSQTIANAAKNKLMGRGSMLVARSRTTLVGGMAEEDAVVAQTTVRPKPTISRRRRSLLPSLGVLYTEPQSIDDGNPTSLAGEYQPSQDSDKSSSPSPPEFLSKSPTLPSHLKLQPTNSEDQDSQHYHRRARSLVGSVKGLMRRTTKSATAQQVSETWQVVRPPEASSSDNGESTETGSKASIGRRRVSSAPTSPIQPANSLSCFLDPGQHSPALSASSDTSTPPSPCEMDYPTPSTTPGSKLSSKHTDTFPLDSHQTLKPRRSFKSLVFYNRLTAVDPI